MKSEIATILREAADKIEAVRADKPEPRKAREWKASISSLGEIMYYKDGDESDPTIEPIRVREILPGDPTMEQVAELVKTAEALRDYIEAQKWGNAWPGRPQATMDALNSALSPFHKP
jgi:hypothetical protein